MLKKNLNADNLLRTAAAAAPLLLFLPALLSGKTLFWGTPVMQFIPWKYLAFESLKAGNLPLWNPFNGMGAPLLANYQLAFFYPPNWIGYAFAAAGGVSWMAWGETLVVALHLSWAAAGMMLFQKRIGVNLAGQLVSGLAFGMSGYLVARVGFFSIVIASTWLPWVMLAGTELADQVSADAWARRPLTKAFLFLWLCCTLQLLSGHAQITFYTIILLMIWVIMRGFLAGGVKEAAAVITAHAAALMLAAATAAVQLLPTLEYLLDSQRSANVDYSIAMVYSFWPWRFLTLLFPDFFGNPGLGNYWGYANFWEDAVYVGILPLAAALGTMFHLWKKQEDKNGKQKKAARVFFWCVVPIGFLLALGTNTPVFPFLYRYIPTFDMFNGPARFLIWVEFALAALAGLGVERWEKPQERALRWTRLAVAGSAAVSIGALLSYFYLKGVNVTFVPAAAWAGVLGALTAVLALKIPPTGDDKGGRLWKSALVLLIVLDLFAAGWKINPFIDAGFYARSGADAGLLRLDDGQRLYLAEESEYRLKFDRFFTFKSHYAGEDWNNLWAVNLPNTNILTGTQMLNNFDPLLPSRFARLSSYLAALDPPGLVEILPRYSVTGLKTADEGDPGKVILTPIEGEDRVRLYPCAITADSEEEAWRLSVKQPPARAAGSGGTALVVEKGGNPVTEPCLDSVQGRARLAGHRPEEIVIEMDTSTGAWLEVAEAWYPGWTASIDGEPAELYPSSYIFKSVYVPGGHHQIIMQYRPASMTAGAAVSVVSFLIAAMICYFARKPGKINGENQP